MSTSVPIPMPADPREALTTFVTCAQLMLDPSTPETQRQRTEPRLLAQLPVLAALGLFDLFDIRDPALAALVRDELAARRSRAQRPARSAASR